MFTTMHIECQGYRVSSCIQALVPLVRGAALGPITGKAQGTEAQCIHGWLNMAIMFEQQQQQQQL